MKVKSLKWIVFALFAMLIVACEKNAVVNTAQVTVVLHADGIQEVTEIELKAHDINMNKDYSNSALMITVPVGYYDLSVHALGDGQAIRAYKRGIKVEHDCTIEMEASFVSGDAGFVLAEIFFAGTVAEMGAYNGPLKVCGQIATFDYLWNEVRVKGGAYGTGFSANPNGMIGAYSFRDPDPANALRAFRSAGPVIRDMELSEAELESYIIGTISNMEPLQSPLGRVLLADMRWLSGVTWEDRCRIRREVMNTTAEQLKETAEKVSSTLAEAPYCIVGSREGLQKFAGDITILGTEE